MLFSRRAIQRMLDENAAWIGHKPLQRHVDDLNSAKSERDTLAAIWEIAVLNGLSKFVDVIHEPKTGSHTPDIVYRADEEQVVAEITTISDKDRHKNNPVERLNDEFMERVSPLISSGLKGGFYLAVRGRSQRRTIKGAPPPQSHLPHVSRFKEVIFTHRFDEFLVALKRAPIERHCYRVNTRDCKLEFGFNPASSGWTFESPLYTQATILRKNVLWNGLDAKRRQLEKANLPGHRGIVVCDGDCCILQTESSWDHYGCDDIIREFLKAHRSIEFVLVLVPRHLGFRHDFSPENHFLSSKIYYWSRDFPVWLKPMSTVASAIPQICNTASNARSEIEWRRENNLWNESDTLAGRMCVSDARIKISARTLLQLLAGVLRQDQFESEHQMARGNPFLQKLANGQLIEAMRIEKDGMHENDELVVFEFGPPDPAISPFRAPGHGKSHQNNSEKYSGKPLDTGFGTRGAALFADCGLDEPIDELRGFTVQPMKFDS